MIDVMSKNRPVRKAADANTNVEGKKPCAFAFVRYRKGGQPRTEATNAREHNTIYSKSATKTASHIVHHINSAE